MVIRYFLNRDLARRFDINLARWKRWSREFLPPDPLGGMQSGFARQYSIKDAFTVFLGGHLVADLKFSIPETKQILVDLNAWLLAQDYFVGYDTSASFSEGAEKLVDHYHIFITKKRASEGHEFSFVYRIQGKILQEDTRYQGFGVQHAYFTENLIDPYPEPAGALDIKSTKLLNITAIYKYFTDHLIAAEAPEQKAPEPKKQRPWFRRKGSTDSNSPDTTD